MSYIQKMTEQFITDSFRGRMVGNRLENLIAQSISTADDIENPLDSVKFLTKVLEKNEEKYQEHLKGCTNKNGCPENLGHEKIAYKLTKELKRYNKNGLTDDIFTTEEKEQADSKLDKILSHLQTIKDGQEIIYNDIAELKELHFLGKKNWKQLAVGKLTGVVAAGVIEEATAKDLLEGITELPKLLGM
jgi:hypothetical protein